MTEKHLTTDIRRLSEAVRNLQKCLECTICLELMTAPIKSKCGHSFCQLCIGKILHNRNAQCPLCKSSLKRRSISKDDHLEICVEKFRKLIIAIQMDSHIDILSYSKQPRDTKESCSNSSDSSRNNSSKRKVSKERSNRGGTKASRSLINQGKMIDCKNLKTDPDLQGGKIINISSVSDIHILLDDKENDKGIHPIDSKVRTWLHSLPNEPSTSVLSIQNQMDLPKDITTSINTITNDDEKSDKPNYLSCSQSKRRSLTKAKKAIRDNLDCNVEDVSQGKVNEDERINADEIKKSDSTANDLKYIASHARVRANMVKTRKKLLGAKKSKEKTEKMSDLKNLSSTAANEQTHEIVMDTTDCSISSSVGNTKQASMKMNWSRVIEFGKEMRTKKKKVRKLNVNAEKSKNPPRIVEDIVLTPTSRYDPTKSIVNHNVSNNEENISTSYNELNSAKHVPLNTISNTEVPLLKMSNKVISDIATSITKNKTTDNSSSEANYITMDTSYIMLEEGKQIHIKNLNDYQMSDIIGFEGNRLSATNALEKNQNLKEDINAPTEPCDSLQSSCKILTVQAPKKRETIDEIVVASTCGSSSIILVKDQTPNIHTINCAQKASEIYTSQIQSATPNISRLSLKRNISDSKSVNSPLSDHPCNDALSIDKHNVTEDINASNNIDPLALNDSSLLKKLTNIKRDLSSQMINEDRSQIDPANNVSLQTIIKIDDNHKKVHGDVCNNKKIVKKIVQEYKPSEVKKDCAYEGQRRGCLVQFRQHGPFVKRRKVKYLYLAATKYEQLVPAELRVSTIHNMQPSQPYQRNESRTYQNNLHNLHTSLSPSNNSQTLSNITAIENIVFVNELHTNSNVILEEKVGLPGTSPICNIPASSTPKIESNNYQQKIFAIECSTMNEMDVQSPHQTPCKDKNLVRRRTLHAHPKTSNSIKMLSPEKDSQLKFLEIDSPASEHDETKRTMLMQRSLGYKNSTIQKNLIIAKKHSQYESSKIKQDFTSESSEYDSKFQSSKKRKRIRSATVKELFKHELTSDDRSDDRSNDSDMVSDSHQRIIKRDQSPKSSISQTDSSVRKKRRLNSLNEENIEEDRSDYKKQETNGKKFKRIIAISSSDTDSESASRITKNFKRNKSGYQCNASVMNTPKEKCLLKRESDEDLRIRNIVDRWHSEHNASQTLLNKNKNIECSLKSVKCSPEKKMRTHLSSSPINIPETNITEKRKDLKLQKDSATVETNLFDSNSMFDLVNLDGITARQSTAEKITESFNDDIVNKVLQIERSRNNPNADRLENSALQDDKMGSQKKDRTRYDLLQNNFDETIASVELQRSKEPITCTEQPDYDLDRTLTEQKTSNRMIDETCGIMQGTSSVLSSTANDMFEHCDYSGNIKKSSANCKTTNLTLGKSNKKNNVYTGNQRKEDQKDKRNVANVVNTIDKDDRKKVTATSNTSEKTENSFDCDSPEQKLQASKKFRTPTKSKDQPHVDDDKMERATAAGNESNLQGSFGEHDTLMNVTQHQVQLQIFEEDLFGIGATRDLNKMAKITRQVDVLQEQQRTPRKKKQQAYTKKSTTEEHSGEEDDIVENTPERKMKNIGCIPNVTEPVTKKNIIASHLSPISKLVKQNSITSTRDKELSKCDASMPINRPEIHPLCRNASKLSHDLPMNIHISMKDKTLEHATSGMPSPKQIEDKALENIRHVPDKEKLCFVCSSITSSQITRVKEFTQKHNVEYRNQFDPSVTHVIVSTTGEENVAQRTLKYLQGIAHRKWIVSYKWIDDCIKKQKLLDETPYEATTDGCDANGAGPRNSRLREKDLFEDFTFLCIGPYVNVALSQYQDLLVATGATVVNSLEALAVKKTGLKGVVIQDNIHDDKVIEHWYRTARAAPIVIDWIVECIARYKLCSLSPYIQSLSPQHFYDIGYPPKLLEDEVEYSDLSTQ